MSKLNKNESACLVDFELSLPIEFVAKLSKVADHVNTPMPELIEEFIVNGVENWEITIEVEETYGADTEPTEAAEENNVNSEDQ